MREILFRGKRMGSNEWIEGGIVHQTDYYGDSVDRYFIIDGTDTDDEIGPAYRVYPDSVGQFTGLTDKNGKKIFEGDIIKICYDSPLFDGYDTECICYNGIVKYENALFVCEENSERGDALCALSSNEFEIIGNIHDNPELLGR